MSTYRVGPEGATVYTATGEPMARLRPGALIVEGTLETAQTRYERAQKRVKGYADKQRVPAEDKS